MSFHYGQGYPRGGGPPMHHPPPGGQHGGAGAYGAPHAGPYGERAPYGGYGAQGHMGQYGQGQGGTPAGPYGGGHNPAGSYGGYGGQPQGGHYGHNPTAGNIPPGVNPEAYQWFQTVDTDHSGFISHKELRQALVNCNSTAFSDETCRMMMNMFDKTRTGRMDLFGFSALWVFIQQWKALFQQYDRDHSGSISGTELHQALAQMGYNLSLQFTEALVSRFAARGGRPGIQLDRFIHVCTQLQSMTQVFREKDTGITGTIRMGYEDFLTSAITRLM